MPTGGPTLLGVDVIWVATILSGIATLAVLTAIYAATTVKDQAVSLKATMAGHES